MMTQEDIRKYFAEDNGHTNEVAAHVKLAVHAADVARALGGLITHVEMGEPTIDLGNGIGPQLSSLSRIDDHGAIIDFTLRQQVLWYRLAHRFMRQALGMATFHEKTAPRMPSPKRGDGGAGPVSPDPFFPDGGGS